MRSLLSLGLRNETQQINPSLIIMGFFGNVIMEEKPINPTNKQAQASLRVCQMLSNSYKDIHLFRFDDQVGDVFILAGDDIQIVVPPTGYWYFL